MKWQNGHGLNDPSFNGRRLTTCQPDLPNTPELVVGFVSRYDNVVRAIHAAPADAPTEVEYVRGQLIGEPVRIEAVRRVSR